MQIAQYFHKWFYKEEPEGQEARQHQALEPITGLENQNAAYNEASSGPPAQSDPEKHGHIPNATNQRPHTTPLQQQQIPTTASTANQLRGHPIGEQTSLHETSPEPLQ